MPLPAWLRRVLPLPPDSRALVDERRHAELSPGAAPVTADELARAVPHAGRAPAGEAARAAARQALEASRRPPADAL